MRKEFGERFQGRYGVKLGFMSFFVKAAIDALKEYPELNAEIRGTDIVVSQLLRHRRRDRQRSRAGRARAARRRADELCARSSNRSPTSPRGPRANKLTLEELHGGTFTITNGGVFGSLLSTPIVNPPQSGVLGMHAIQERPVARDGQVVIRPMMYVALTYDHRIVDGREAVTFLVRIKEAIEEPARMLIEA